MGRILTGPGSVAKSGDTMLGPLNEAQGKDIPSATSINLVISTGNLVDITGGNTIISMTLGIGAERVLRFTGSLRLTNSSSLVLPGGEDIITTPGDFATVRGYSSGVVRCVSYTRASGYVQRVGDTLKGTLTLSPGSDVSPPMKYQTGSLTTLPVPHAAEWDGTNLFQTSSGGVRKKVLFTDGDGSSLSGLTQQQIVSALGYYPSNPANMATAVNPPGGLTAFGRFIDMHYLDYSNLYDIRFECYPPTSGYGSSTLSIEAHEIQLNGYALWSKSTLTNLGQLNNTPGYVLSGSPTFTGQVTFPEGSPTAPGITFQPNEAQSDTGMYHISDGVFGVACDGLPIVRWAPTGMIIYPGNTGIGGGITFDRSPNSTLMGAARIDTIGTLLRFYEFHDPARGAYLDIDTCLPNVATKILTDANLPTQLTPLLQTQMPSSLQGSSGYQKMPSGMIMQWGTMSGFGQNSGRVTYPTPFANSGIPTATGLGNGYAYITAQDAYGFNYTCTGGLNWTAMGW